jgi:hypothetical protein
MILLSNGIGLMQVLVAFAIPGFDRPCLKYPLFAMPCALRSLSRNIAISLIVSGDEHDYNPR